jgi:hypothetical protein
VRLDDGLQALHLHLGLHEPHGPFHLGVVGDVADLLVVGEPVAQLGIERLLGSFTNPGDARAHSV